MLRDFFKNFLTMLVLLAAFVSFCGVMYLVVTLVLTGWLNTVAVLVLLAAYCAAVGTIWDHI